MDKQPAPLFCPVHNFCRQWIKHPSSLKSIAMPNDKRNKGERPREEQRPPSSTEQGGATQNLSNEQDSNPQDGGSWNNYRTREMGGSAASDENFYRNRERGNYEEGQGSDDDGGGSLY